ncbi:hypothetical protein [Lactobacillus crispatus]|uniref:hypothetical protein n=1 Tax=Lactobacillus crispatus TaxID=47770 RepID=UPI0015DD9D7B|nr:hypothetical protein [Lactobacillus crispatus]QLK32462.1 hypothetical protein H0G71_08825 [Lactobacillus crispatus]
MSNNENIGFNSLLIKIYELSLFSLCFTYCLSTIYIFDNNNLVNILNIAIQAVSYPILIILILNSKYSQKEFFLIFIVGILLVNEFFHNYSTNWLRYFLLFLASQKIPFTKILKTLLSAFVSIFILGIFLYILGISNAGIARREAVTFGFTQPNILAMIIITINLIIFILYREYKIFDFLLALGSIIFISLFLKTQTAAIVLILFPLIYIFVKREIRLNNRFALLVIEGSQILILLITCLLLFLYPKTIYDPFRTKIDTLFSYRPYLNYNNVMQYGFSLFGRQINIFNTSDYAYNYFGGFLSNQRYNTVDNSYIIQLISIGIITIIPVYIFYIKMIKKAIKNHRYAVITVAILCCFYAFIENNYNEAYYFFPFFYLMSIDDLSSVNFGCLDGK